MYDLQALPRTNPMDKLPEIKREKTEAYRLREALIAVSKMGLGRCWCGHETNHSYACRLAQEVVNERY